MDYTSVEAPAFEEELQWQGRRNLALALTILAVALTTLAVGIAALLVH